MPFFPFEFIEVPGCEVYAPALPTSSIDHGLGAKTRKKMLRMGCLVPCTRFSLGESGSNRLAPGHRLRISDSREESPFPFPRWHLNLIFSPRVG